MAALVIFPGVNLIATYSDLDDKNPRVRSAARVLFWALLLGPLVWLWPICYGLRRIPSLISGFWRLTGYKLPLPAAVLRLKAPAESGQLSYSTTTDAEGALSVVDSTDRAK